MKILHISNFFYLLGGGSRYFFEVSKHQKKIGHDIAYFSMHDYKNYSTKWKKYFVSYISFEKVDYLKGFKVLERMLYSVEARKKISNLLDNFNCKLVHLHDIYHHISPSILQELHKRKMPIVQTIGDYHLISPNYNMFHNKHICEITKPYKFYKAFFHKCVKNSYIASFGEILEKYFHLFLDWERNYIDYFIAPSKFMKNKLIEYEIDPKKIIHLPYFIDSNKYIPNHKMGDYILYFGRLSEEKGINILIKAMKLLPKINLKIVGRGYQKDDLKIMKKELGLKNVKFLGFKEGDELKKLISDSRFSILPSVWYEVFGLSILESFASGKPVVASNIGGIPEIVKDGYNGILMEPGNIDDCAEKINRLWNNPSLCRIMGKNARKYIVNKYSPEGHYKKLMKIYNNAKSLHI